MKNSPRLYGMQACRLFLTPGMFLLFFNVQGNNATDGCCSKCWRDKQKKEGSPAEDATPMEIVEEKPNEATKNDTAVEEKPAGELKPTEIKKKKKKKKASYKNMMAGMMQTADSRDIDKEKERINNVTGGGAFTKIDKI